MEREITEAQELHLRLIEAVGAVNNLNGPAIAADLRKHKNLWLSAVFAREVRVSASSARSRALASQICLIHLRDLPQNHVNLDTLFVLPVSGEQTALQSLVETWIPDETMWFSVRDACQAMGEAVVKHRAFRDPARFLLKAWWD